MVQRIQLRFYRQGRQPTLKLSCIAERPTLDSFTTIMSPTDLHQKAQSHLSQDTKDAVVPDIHNSQTGSVTLVRRMTDVA